MFCTKCGTKIPDGGRFCPSCGEPAADLKDWKAEQTQDDSTARAYTQTDAEGEKGASHKSAANDEAADPQGEKPKKKRHGALFTVIAAVVAVVVVFAVLGISGVIGAGGGKSRSELQAMYMESGISPYDFKQFTIDEWGGRNYYNENSLEGLRADLNQFAASSDRDFDVCGMYLMTYQDVIDTYDGSNYAFLDMLDIVELCYNYNGYGGASAVLTSAWRDEAYSLYAFLFKDTAFGPMDMCFYITGNSMIAAVIYEDNEPGYSRSLGIIQAFLEDAGYEDIKDDIEEIISVYTFDIKEDAGSIFEVRTE